MIDLYCFSLLCICRRASAQFAGASVGLVALEVSGLVALEVLDFSLVLLCLIHGVERAQVAAFSRGWVFLAGVEAELTGL